mmetsp:Transcript_6722/g.17197  ORF Transcript_6722/g.17197 Transcript_6722/m.17197 type:complete len:287 (+) Transcript_6722:3367-4227(+)
MSNIAPAIPGECCESAVLGAGDGVLDELDAPVPMLAPPLLHSGASALSLGSSGPGALGSCAQIGLAPPVAISASSRVPSRALGSMGVPMPTPVSAPSALARVTGVSTRPSTSAGEAMSEMPVGEASSGAGLAARGGSSRGSRPSHDAIGIACVTQRSSCAWCGARSVGGVCSTSLASMEARRAPIARTIATRQLADSSAVEACTLYSRCPDDSCSSSSSSAFTSALAIHPGPNRGIEPRCTSLTSGPLTTKSVRVATLQIIHATQPAPAGGADAESDGEDALPGVK